MFAKIKIFTLYPDLFPGPLELLVFIKKLRKLKYGI